MVDKITREQEHLLNVYEKQAEAVKKVGDATEEIEKQLNFRTGMAGMAGELLKSMQNQSTVLNDQLGTLSKQALLNKANKAYQSKATSAEIASGKAAEIVWSMQKRISTEREQGVVAERTYMNLRKEFISEMGLSLKQLEAQPKLLQQMDFYIKSISKTTKQYADMSAEEIQSLNKTNEKLDEMSSRWEGIKKSVTDTKDTVSALLSSPGVAASVFGYEALKNVGKVGESFGEILNTGIGIENVTGGMAQNMGSAWVSSVLYGASVKDIADATKSIAEEMGSIEHATKENIKGAVKLMKFYDMDASSAAKITKQFDQIGKLTGQTHEELRSSVTEMANLGKVAPTAIFEDLSSNAESIAKWLDASGTNMIELAVSSRQLGLSMGDTLAMTEGILDFETSIEKQMQASVMTGRSFNFEQARMLAFAGDHEGALKNIVSQLGTEQEFMQMNMYQRQSMADMLNTSVDSLKDMIINQNKLGQETGKFSKFWEETYGYMKGAFSFVNKDNIIMMSALVGTLKNLGGFQGIGAGIKGAPGKVGGFFSNLFKKGGTKNIVESVQKADTQIGAKSPITDPKRVDTGKGGIAGWIKSWDGVKWSSLGKIAVALAIIGVAIYGFGKVISTLPTDPKQYLAAGVMMVGLVGSIYALSKIAQTIDMANVVKGALAMAIIGAAFLPLAGALKLIEGVSWKALAIAGTALVGLTAAVMGLGLLMGTGVGALVFGAGIIALISLSGALLLFGTALAVISKNADGVNYLASSLSMLAQSMQELASVNSSLNDIKPVLKTIHKIETAFEPTKTNEPATVTATEAKLQSMKFDELINQIKLLRSDVQKGMQLDGKRVSRAIANVTGN